MALVVKDRVRETTTTTGTGSVSLAGPVTGFQSFSVIGDTNTTYYAIVDAATGEWEVGIGTYTLSGTTLSRDTVLESSNSGALVPFIAGTKDVFCTYPAERSVYADETNATVTIPSLTTGGNVNFTGTGNRITGDFSNATLANRVFFQTSTVNGATNVGFIPNGISTTTRLNLLNTTSTTDYSVGSLLATAADVRLVSDAAGTGTQLPLTFYTNGSERMRIDSSGNVGIGTTAPTELLSIRKNQASGTSILIENGLTDSSAYSTISAGSDVGNIVLNANSSLASTSALLGGGSGASLYTTSGFSNGLSVGTFSGPLKFFAGSSTTERMRIDSSGNVGIGTTAPASRLHVSDAGSVADNCFNVSTPANDNVLVGANLVVDAAGTYTKPATSLSGAGILFAGINNLNSYGTISFLSAPDTNTGSATPITQMIIDADGNVGLKNAVTAPIAPLHIGLNEPGGEAIRLSWNTGATTQAEASIGFGRSLDAVYPNAAIAGQETDTSDLRGNLLFYTRDTDTDVAPTERLRIGSDGRIQINGGSAATSTLVGTSNTFPLNNATTAYQFRADATFGTANTSAIGFGSTYDLPATGAFTSSYHFYAGVIATGGATITNNYGLYITGQTVGTNIYGVYSDIDSGTNRYNFYANGTADNYFAGNVGIGTTAPGALLDVTASNNGLTSITANNALRFTDTDTTTAANQPIGVIEFYTSDTSAGGTGVSAYILSAAAGTSGGGDLRFGTAGNTSSGSPAERLRIVAADGTLTSQPTYDNTAAGSTVVVTSAGLIRRTSSSLKYKKDVETLDYSLASNAIENLRPVWYRTKTAAGDDKETWSHIGLIAEEVHEIEPRLVRYRTVEVNTDEFGERVETPLEVPEPEDVDYGRLAVLLLAEVKTMKNEISNLKAEIAALKGV